MENDINIKALIGPIKRQIKLIMTIMIAFVALAGIVALSITPKFEATSLLYVDTDSKSLLGDEQIYSNSSSDNAKVASEVEIVKSDGVILSLIERMGLVGDAEFGPKLSRLQQVLIRLGLSDRQSQTGSEALSSVITSVKNAVSVQRRGLTYIISVSARSEDADKAAELANILSETYIESQLQSKVNNVNVSLAAVQRQLAETEGSVVATQQVVSDFISDNFQDIANANAGTDLVDLNRELDALKQQKFQAEIQRRAFRDSLSGGMFISDMSGLKTDALRALEAQRDRLTSRISQQTIDSISLVDLRAQLDIVERNIQSESRTILRGVEDTISSVESSILEMQTSLNDRVLSGDIQLPDNIGAQLFRLSQQTRNTNSQYQALLAKAQDLEAEALLQIADSRVISPAISPKSPVSPNVTLIIAAALVFGTGLALSIAFIIENFIGGFTDPDQLEDVTGRQVAVTIRTVALAKRNVRSISELVLQEPLSIFAENIRKLRTSIQIVFQNQAKAFAPDGPVLSQGKVIMVGSSVPGEGKTSISMSLARTLAVSGAKTLIIDCDVRQPSIAYETGIRSEKSVANLFSNNISLKNLAANVEIDSRSPLHILISHRNELKEAQFIYGFQPFEAIINLAKTKYDHVILDTPPIGPVADALTLAGFADIVIFAVKWAKTSQKSVQESLKLIHAMAPDTPVLMVLNHADETSDGSYAQYSDYYSDG